MAAPLSWAYALLVLYASLFPFSGWRWPPGHKLLDLLALPWPPWVDPFDVWANLSGYLPWGWLLLLALRPRLGSASTAWACAVILPALVSYLVEVTQTFLPNRHPSLKDLAMNTLGAAFGATLALVAARSGFSRWWGQLRERCFVPRSGGALALLSLWPFALLFPTPFPLGLGQIGTKLRDLIEGLLDGVPWADALLRQLQASPPISEPLSPMNEGLATALGLFVPCMLAYTVSRRGAHRIALSIGAALVGTATLALSALLNYGPSHAFAWLTASTPAAMLAGLLAACSLAFVPRRVACGLALMGLAAGLALVMQAPEDPYFALNLQAWESGRWVQFHGVTQWVGLAWPYVAMLWLLRRLADSNDDEPS